MADVHSRGTRVESRQAGSVPKMMGTQWPASHHATIADIARYPDAALAGGGRLSLAGYPQLRTRLKQMVTLPGCVPTQGA
jgi:hypothetical protein